MINNLEGISRKQLIKTVNIQIEEYKKLQDENDKLENRIQELENGLSSIAGTDINNVVSGNLTADRSESEVYHHLSRLVTFNIDDNMVTFMRMRENLIKVMQESWGTRGLSYDNLESIKPYLEFSLGLNYCSGYVYCTGFGPNSNLRFRCLEDVQ